MKIIEENIKSWTAEDLEAGQVFKNKDEYYMVIAAIGSNILVPSSFNYMHVVNQRTGLLYLFYKKDVVVPVNAEMKITPQNQEKA